MSRHTGSHFIVTGAGSGIGRAIACRLAADGARVSLLGRRLEPLEASAQLAREAGAEAVLVQGCDVRDPASVEQAVAESAAALGPLRGLVANAGIGGVNVAGEADRWDDLVQTNLSGTYHCFRAAQGHLAEGPEPRHLLAMSSILGRIGVGGYTGYCASKAGILGLVRALAVELAGDNVQVNGLCPGWVDTEMAREGLRGLAAALNCSEQEAYANAMSQVPLGRMSQPEDIAALSSWLLSGEARGITGQAIDMNNGAFMI